MHLKLRHIQLNNQSRILGNKLVKVSIWCFFLSHTIIGRSSCSSSRGFCSCLWLGVRSRLPRTGILSGVHFSSCRSIGCARRFQWTSYFWAGRRSELSWTLQFSDRWSATSSPVLFPSIRRKDSRWANRWLLLQQRRRHLHPFINTCQSEIGRSAVESLEYWVLEDSEISHSCKSWHQELSVHVFLGSLQIFFDFGGVKIVLSVSLVDDMRFFLFRPELPWG